MTIQGLDPSGDLGRIFFQVQSQEVHAQKSNLLRPASPHSAADPVDLSTLVQEIRDYTARASQVPEFRGDKIQRVQQALDAGTELATSEQVAEAMTRETMVNAFAF
jgi:hypothetical protein